MSRIMNAREIGIETLRKIGAYVVADSGPDGTELDVAVSSLDIVLAHYLSTNRFWFLVPTPLSLELTAAQADYDLASELGSDWPTDGLIFPISVWLEDEAGNPQKVDLVRRDQWDELDHGETGTPKKAYFDRSTTSTVTLKTWPTLSDTAQTWTLKITAQKFAPRISGLLVSPEVATGLPAAWNMWAIYQNCAYCADGTIRRLSQADIEGFEKKAMALLADLEGFANDEHADDAIAEPWGQ